MENYDFSELAEANSPGLQHRLENLSQLLQLDPEAVCRRVAGEGDIWGVLASELFGEKVTSADRKSLRWMFYWTLFGAK